MYKEFEKVIFRFPQFSFDLLEQCLFNKSYAIEIYKSKEFKEAIYIASPLLYEELEKYLSGNIKEKDKQKLENTLFRYLTRMSTRCTPFGTFAGVSIGSVGESNDIKISDNIQKKTRLDMFFLCSLFQHIIKISEIRHKTVYYPNSTIFEINNKYRYIEYYYANNNRKHQIVEIQKNEFSSLILKEVKNGKSFSDLIRILETFDISQEDAITYINNLIDSQLIVNELEPSFIGDDYFTYLTYRLEETECKHSILKSLKKIHSFQQELDKNPKDFHRIYEDIYKEIQQIGIPCNKSTIFQVDCKIETENCLISKKTIEDVYKTICFINKITPPGKNESLEAFKRSFAECYENQEMPLMEVLDPNIGIGYPIGRKNHVKDTLLAKFILPVSSPEPNLHAIDPIDIIMQKKIFDFNIEKSSEIVLTDQDVINLNENWEDLPLSMSASIELIDSDSFRMKGAGGSSAANLIARFAHCDKQIKKIVEEITTEEQINYKDKLLAEIIHLPESRMGNILARPYARGFNLVYLAGNTKEKQNIPIQDLMLSVKNNRLFIRSKKLNKEILPRLTSAHNYLNNPTPIYLFLCDMQFQNIRESLYFKWGASFQSLEYLPRVIYSNAILFPETWNMPVKDWNDIINEKEDLILLQKTKKIKDKYRLKKELLLVDEDNMLYINLDSTNSIRAFLDIIKNRKNIKLEEFIYDKNKSPVKSPKGEYRNECIIAFHKYTHEKK